MKRDVPVKLEHILDVVALKGHIEAGNVSVQKHPLYNLRILNYTPQATFTDVTWDSTLSLCRGLIVDMNDEVIARPFAKFWNLNTAKRPETMVSALPKGEFQALQKMDGSLGILYEYDGQYAVSTRGSFQSDQAKWATTWYQNHCREWQQTWPEGWTPLFEIIYPENRIVCSYHYSALVLIGMVHIATGEEMPWESLNFWAGFNTLRISRRVVGASVAELATHKADNEEGYVLTWFDPYLKVKVKFEEYVRLHRIITGFNSKTVWELISQGEWQRHGALTLDETLPREFRNWLARTTMELNEAYRQIQMVAKNVYNCRPNGNRKEIADYIFRTSYLHMGVPAVVFAMLDGKDYDSIIWKMIKPKADKVFRVDGEA